MGKGDNIIYLLSHKHLATIVELQKLAMGMTMNEFIEFIKADYNVRESEFYIDFDYHDLTATINKTNHTLSGSIDIWDEEGTWCDTFFCQCVSFKS